MPEIISRQVSLRKKLKYYYTGKKCHKGHLSKRITVSALCHECYRDIRKKYHQTDKYKKAIKNYQTSKKGKRTLENYKKTSEYKLMRKASLKKFRSSEKQRLIFERYYKTKKGEITNMWRTLRIRLKNWTSNKNARAKSEMQKIIGCDKKTLRAHLESKFKPGMSWQNHGKWHIDHIIPLYKFDPTKYEDIKKANHYSNLQPLWADENLRKNRF
jgi:hypothetical protein